MKYECSECGASGVKLWRRSNEIVDCQTLECVDCACESQRVSPQCVHNNGRVWCIGMRVPAVPTDYGTFWLHTSVPDERLKWWRSLPLRTAERRGPMTERKRIACSVLISDQDQVGFICSRDENNLCDYFVESCFGRCIFGLSECGNNTVHQIAIKRARERL